MKHYNASGSVVQISQKCGINFAEVWYKFRRGVVQEIRQPLILQDFEGPKISLII